MENEIKENSDDVNEVIIENGGNDIEKSESPQESDEEVKPKERTKPRIPSALTVENVKKHEEETDAIDVVELMTKNVAEDATQAIPTEEQNEPSKSDEKKEEKFPSSKPLPPIGSTPKPHTDVEEPLDYPAEDRAATPLSEKMAKKKEEAEQLLSTVWSQPKKQTIEPLPQSPAVREEVRGTRYTGEEYIAVSIDVQTEESYFTEMFEWPHDNLDISPYSAHPSRAQPASDGIKSFASEKKRQKKHITSDLSSVDVEDGESFLHIPQSRSATSGIVESKHSGIAESDIDEDNPVTIFTESEFGGSEAPTETTHDTSHTLPNVGPPYILQYKPESRMVPLDYGDIDMPIPEDLSWDDMTEEQRLYYQNMMEEMKRIRQERMEILHPQPELISIDPHTAYGSRRDRKMAKERERERSRMREMEKQAKQTTGGQMMANQTNFYAFARQLKTVNYALSSEKCLEEGWTIRPDTPPTPEVPDEDVYVHDPNDDIMTGKRYKYLFVRKLYPNGQLFLTVFPDGTGNVWYPSGNLAVSIIASEKAGKLIFILHEDAHPTEDPSVQAVFEPSGNCTCYYPSGVVRLLLNPIGGDYFSANGERLKRWIWKDTRTHVHAPPFQPITFALSRKVSVRVMSQESIYITFTDGMRSVRFNAGTRLRLRPSLVLPKIERVDIDQVMLEEKKSYVQSILERINNSFKFPNSPRLKKIKLPNYLTSQIERTARLKALLLEQELMEPKKPEKKPKKSALRQKSSTKSISSSIQPVQVPQRNLKHHLYRKKKEPANELKPVVIVN